MPAIARRHRPAVRGLRPALGPAAAAGCAVGALLLTPVAAAERLPLRIYSAADGLPGDQIERIVEDHRGFLWFAALGGLARFDGYSFTNFGPESGLPSAELGDLLETRNGVLWTATARGLCRFAAEAVDRRHLFECTSIGDTPASNRVGSLLEDAAGNLWAGTSDGLFRLTPDPERPAGVRAARVALPIAVPAGSRLAVGALVGGPDGDVWAGTFGGIARLSPGGELRRVYPIQRPLGSDNLRDNNRVFGLLFDSSGRLWVGLGYDGVVVLRPEERLVEGPVEVAPLLADTPRARVGDDGRLDLAVAPGQARRLTTDEGLVSDWARRGFLETRDGTLWIGTSRGLARLQGDRLTRYVRSAGLPDVDVEPQTEDSAGNLWLSTESAGVIRIARQGFTSFTDADGLAGEKVASIGEDRDGRLFAVTLEPRRLFVHGFDGERFRAVAPRLPPAVGAVGWGFHQTSFQGRDGTWWVATGDGLLRYPPGTRTEKLDTTEAARYTHRDGLGGDDVFRLYEDRRGDLWIGTFGPGYLTRRDRATGSFQVYTGADGIPDAAPTAFAEDRGGGLWIAFYDGTLARFDGGRFRVLPAGSTLPAGFVHALWVDRRGRLWITCRGDGVARLDRPERAGPYRFARFRAGASGLSNGYVSCIVEDAVGRIYLCTAGGVDRLDETGRVAHFSTADGLASNLAQSAYRDRRGNLWFATYRGVSRLAPRAEEPSTSPRMWITELRVSGVPRPLPQQGVAQVGDVELVAGRGTVEVGFVGLGFATGERLRYQHRLGAEPWSAPSEQRSVLLASLGAGSYRFAVRAVAVDGRVSDRPATLELSVLPPLYRRGWFLALAAAVAIAAAVVAVRSREARRMAMERVRTRIAADLHDDIGASLSRISILSEVAARRLPTGATDSEQTIREIGAAARGLFDAVAEVVWAIDPRRDDLRNVVARLAEYAGELLRESGTAWSLDVPSEADRVGLSTEVRRDLFLLLKEALHNAARHAGARAVSLAVRLEGNRLLAAVRDDGRGLPPELDASGDGLRNMRERATALGGCLSIDSAPGRGTTILLAMPRPRLRRHRGSDGAA